MEIAAQHKLRRFIDSPTTRSIVKCLAFCALGRVAKAPTGRPARAKGCCG